MSNSQLIATGIFIIVVLGVGGFILVSSNNQRTASKFTSSPTVAQSSLISGKLINIYQDNNTLWAVFDTGEKKQIYTIQPDDTPPTDRKLRFFMSSDNKYVVWFTARQGLMRYDLAQNLSKMIDNYDPQNADNYTFYQSVGFSRDKNTVYYLDIIKNQIVTITIDKLEKTVAKIPVNKFTTMQLSPDYTKALLGIAHGGPPSGPEHAVINLDGTGYITLPESFERYGFFVRFWSDDSQAIIEDEVVETDANTAANPTDKLVSFDVFSGQKKIFALAPSNTNIDACQYNNHILYCKLRNFSNQISSWYMVKNGTFSQSQISLH